MWLTIWLFSHSVFLYRLLIFELLSSNIRALASINLSYLIIILDDFNVYNENWPLHSSDTSAVECGTDDSAITNNLYQLVDISTMTPDRIGYIAHIFDPILISTSSLFFVINSLPPLRSSDHCLVPFSILFSHPFPIPNSRHTLWHYDSEDCGGFLEFLVWYPYASFCLVWCFC